MNVQDLGAIGEFVSSVAIVITLIFLTIETRQARNATQQSNRQARHRIRSDLNLAVAVNPELCEILAKSTKHLSDGLPIDFSRDLGLSDAEGIQIINYALSVFRHLEDQYFSDLPETDRSGLERQARTIVSLAPMSKLWKQTKQLYDDRFREYLDNLGAMTESEGS